MDTDPSHPTSNQFVTLAVIGCGQRGKVFEEYYKSTRHTDNADKAYSKYALAAPERCKVIAIAEPRPNTRKNFANLYKVDKTLVFDTWEDLLAASAETISTIGKRLADAVIIAVQDHLHAEVAAAFAKQGYHILCEKPMATSISDCLRMESAIKEAGIIFGMGHGTTPPHLVDEIFSNYLCSHALFSVQ